MIRRLKYHEIDFEKYTECLKNSVQKKYCADKIYLDTIAGKNWNVLVLNDYEAVMPLPFVRKFGIKIVQMPPLCQQLGVFSGQDSATVNERFLAFLEENFLVSFYAFNDGNKFKRELGYRKNYIILASQYDLVFSKYSPKRKRKLRIDAEILTRTKTETVGFNEVFPFIKQHFKSGLPEHKEQKYLDIFKSLWDKKLLDFRAFYIDGEIANVIGIYKNEDAAVLLGTFNNPEFVKNSGASLLIDRSIKENISTKMFDFEGSNIPAVEEFFRGFRPDLKPYPFIMNPKKTIIKQILKFKF